MCGGVKEQKPYILTTTCYSREYVKNWLLCKDCNNVTVKHNKDMHTSDKEQKMTDLIQVTSSASLLHTLLSPNSLNLLTSPFDTLLIFLPSACFSVHSKFQFQLCEAEMSYS